MIVVLTNIEDAGIPKSDMNCIRQSSKKDEIKMKFKMIEISIDPMRAIYENRRRDELGQKRERQNSLLGASLNAEQRHEQGEWSG